jgi:hypothetical protein
MSNSEIIIKITKQDDDNIKTVVENNAGDDRAMHIMSGAIKLFLSDEEAMLMYAQLVRSYLESESKDKAKEDEDNAE